MNMTVKLHSDQLDQKFLTGLRQMFADRLIQIEVKTLDEIDEMDETVYLNRSPANRDYLLRAIADVEAGVDLVSVDMDQYR